MDLARWKWFRNSTMEPNFSLDDVESTQFGLHRPSLGSRNFNNFQLFNDEDLEVIGTQMSQHVESS